ncbi:hypothetical protein [Streptomyces noursei]|nr:hypothetical protein [Streptomyces noursei]
MIHQREGGASIVMTESGAGPVGCVATKEGRVWVISARPSLRLAQAA